MQRSPRTPARGPRRRAATARGLAALRTLVSLTLAALALGWVTLAVREPPQPQPKSQPSPTPVYEAAQRVAEGDDLTLRDGVLRLANRGDVPASCEPMRTSSIALRHVAGSVFGPGNLVERCRASCRWCSRSRRCASPRCRSIRSFELAHPEHLMRPMPAAGALAVSPLGLGLVGLSRLRVTVYESGSRVVVLRFEDYWQRDAHGGRPLYLDGIEFVITPDPVVMGLALSTGRLDDAAAGPMDLALNSAPADANGTQLGRMVGSFQEDSGSHPWRSRPPAAAPCSCPTAPPTPA